MTEQTQAEHATALAAAANGRIYVIINPVAGSGRGRQFADDLDQLWPQQDVTVYETTGDESLPDVVGEAVDDGFDLVVAVGGDGTVSGVADGLVNTAVPLLIIPAGTGNALAKELDIPQDLEAAGQLLSEPQRAQQRTLDAVHVDGRYYFLQLGAGVESVTMEETSREAKQQFGILAYLGTAVRELIGMQPNEFTLQIDGREHVLRGAEVVVANSATLGVLAIEWGEHIENDDGVVDIGVIRADSLLDYLRSFVALLNGQARRSQLIRYFAVKESLTIDVKPPLPVHGDGEELGETPFSGEIVPSALHVVVPADG